MIPGTTVSSFCKTVIDVYLADEQNKESEIIKYRNYKNMDITKYKLRLCLGYMIPQI